MKPKTNEQLCVLAQRGDAQAQEQLVKTIWDTYKSLQMNCIKA